MARPTGLRQTRTRRNKHRRRSVGGRAFATVETLKTFVRNMLGTNRLDKRFLDDLITYHPELTRKMDGRTLLTYKVVTTHKVLLGVQLVLVFANGGETSISWSDMCKQVFIVSDKGRAIRAIAKAIQTMKQSARYEVRVQIQAFRRRHPGYEDRHAFHVGHDFVKGQRFEELLRTFLETEGRVVDITKVKDSYEYMFQNREMAGRWEAYHGRHAVLRMETRAENARGNTGFKQNDWARRFV
jgi:hypothetical protein